MGNEFEGSVTHTNFKPILQSNLISHFFICGTGGNALVPVMVNDSTIQWKSTTPIIPPKSKFIKRKLKEESLIIVDDTSGKFHMAIDPLFNFEFGKDLASTDSFPEKLYKNTRGILVRGDIGKDFSFETSFLENQATFVKYIDDYIKSTDTLFPNAINYQYHVIPGQGRSKAFKLNGYDFGFSSGYASYSPNEHFNFQVGHGKHFVGDGYRSLLLSDNSFNYPYLRITTSFWKLQYTNLYTVFMNLTDGGATTPPNTERLFQKKAASFQFLSWNVHERIQLGFFQGLVWEATDTRNRMCLDLSYFDPFIFGNALQFGLGGAHNVVLGSTLKLKITKSISLYGQYLADEFSRDGSGSLHNKTGIQAGFKYFDVFKIRNLHLQLEYNQVRPYTYAHKNTAQSFSHYNQPLAHPLGANFSEMIVFLNYRIGDFFTEFRYSIATVGKDSTGANYGNSIFNSDNTAVYGFNSNVNKQNQGIKTEINYLDFKIGYLINPCTNMNVVMGITMRDETSDYTQNQTRFIYVGLRTSLANHYYDF